MGRTHAGSCSCPGSARRQRRRARRGGRQRGASQAKDRSTARRGRGGRELRASEHRRLLLLPRARSRPRPDPATTREGKRGRRGRRTLGPSVLLTRSPRAMAPTNELRRADSPRSSPACGGGSKARVSAVGATREGGRGDGRRLRIRSWGVEGEGGRGKGGREGRDVPLMMERERERRALEETDTQRAAGPRRGFGWGSDRGPAVCVALSPVSRLSLVSSHQPASPPPVAARHAAPVTARAALSPPAAYTRPLARRPPLAPRVRLAPAAPAALRAPPAALARPPARDARRLCSPAREVGLVPRRPCVRRPLPYLCVPLVLVASPRSPAPG